MKRIAGIILIAITAVATIMLLLQRRATTTYPPESIWAKHAYDHLRVIHDVLSQSNAGTGELASDDSLESLPPSLDIPYSRDQFPTLAIPPDIIIDDILLFSRSHVEMPLAITKYSPNGSYFIIDHNMQISYIRQGMLEYIPPK